MVKGGERRREEKEENKRSELIFRELRIASQNHPPGQDIGIFNSSTSHLLPLAKLPQWVHGLLGFGNGQDFQTVWSSVS